MVLSLFAAHVRDGADHVEDYKLSMGPDMLGALGGVKGFISFNVYTSPDPGWWLGLVRWESMEAIQGWRDDPVHRAAWSRVTEFYDQFHVQHAVSFREMYWEKGEHKIVDPVEYFRQGSIDLGDPPPFEVLYGYPMPEQ